MCLLSLACNEVFGRCVVGTVSIVLLVTHVSHHPHRTVCSTGIFYNISKVKTSKYDVPDIARKNSAKRGMASLEYFDRRFFLLDMEHASLLEGRSIT